MFRSDDLIGIGMEADAVRRRHHPAGVVSYTIERTIDFLQPRDAIFAQIQETIDRGGTGIRFEAGDGNIDRFEELTGAIQAKFPVGLDCVWAPFFVGNSLGLQTTAAMMFGEGETPEQRVDYLEAVRNIQRETGRFTDFLPLPGRTPREEPTAVEYLKTLAISRIYLDNIVNIQSSWVISGLKTCQLGLRFGANDVGSTGGNGASEEDLRHIIRNAGFVPKQRDSLYRTYFLN